jgi:hypothetical protein
VISTGELYTPNGIITNADNKKIALGASADADSYLQFNGTDLQIYSVNDVEIVTGANKTLELSQVVYDDLAVSISDARVPAANAPTWTAYKGSQVLAFSAAADEIIYFTAQLPHGYKQGEDIFFHLHLVCPDANAGNIRWNFTHSWVNVNGNFPGATTVSVNVAASGTTDKHFIGTIGTLSGTGKNLSSLLLCSLQREGTDGVNDTYGSNVYLLSMDFHVPIDTIGSRQAFVK